MLVGPGDEVLPIAVQLDTAQVQQRFGTFRYPTHAGAIHPFANNVPHRSFHLLRFTGVVAGAVLRLVRNLVAWRRSLDIPGWFSMRSIERQTFERSNDWFPAFEETHGDRFG